MVNAGQVVNRKKRREAAKDGKGRTSQIYRNFSSAEIKVRNRIFDMMKHGESKDGIDANDIMQTYSDLGILISKDHANKMMQNNETITFPQFLNMQKSDDVADPRDAIINAFYNFDEEGEGFLSPSLVQKLLTDSSYEDPVDAEIVTELLSLAPKKNGKVSIENLTDILKIGTAEGEPIS
ncbi:MAG: EF hand [Paramarteilia canceri]